MRDPMQRIVWTLLLLVGAFVATGCDDGDDSTQDVIASDTDVAQGCCPRSDSPSGCMQLGGVRASAESCMQTCDFWCSTNWRVETRDGCEVWVYDTRQPEAGENAMCQPE